MPSLSLACLNKLKNDYKEYPIFVETGTSIGNTIFPMESYFKELHTIEILHSTYINTKSRYSGNKITFHLGDSPDILNSLVPQINDPVIFFLDGHYSSCDTGKGVKDVPLLEELQIIMDKLKNKAIIIIDDVRLFGKGPTKGDCAENWEDITKDNIFSIVESRLEQSYFISSAADPNDRYILHLKEQQINLK